MPARRASCNPSRLVKSGASNFGAMATTNSPAPGVSAPSMNEGASSDQFAPVSPRRGLPPSARYSPRAIRRSQQRASHRRTGIGRFDAVVVDRPTLGQFFSVFRALSDSDEGRGAARLIDHQRRSVFDRRGEGSGLVQ